MSLHKGFVVSEPGLEDVSIVEIKELIKTKGTAKKEIVTFSIKTTDDLAHLCYRAQSVKRVCFFLAQFTSKDILTTIEKNVENIDFSYYVDGKKFAVECSRNGNHPFSSADITRKVSGIIIDSIKKSGGENAKVDYKNPDIKFFIYIRDNQCTVGIDYGGFDLAQREYRVFSHAASLKATVVYSILRLAQYKKNTSLVSNFSKSGLFIIEAALFASGKAVNYYRKDKFVLWKLKKYEDTDSTEFFKKIDDKIKKEKLPIRGVNIDLRHVSAGKKNAKIAGVDKFVGFSSIDNEWLDVKYKKEEIDILIAYPAGREKQKMKEFFHQAEYVAKKIVVISLNAGYADVAKEFGFKVKEERLLHRGETKLILQIFEKS